MEKTQTLDQTLLVTAPHPDDDIIGAFGLMRAFPGKVIVWFMTDGGGGERRVEAMRALNDVGVESVVWHNLPFYRTEDRTLSLEDVGVARGVLAMASPTHLAACYDCDPKETHVKCLAVLQQAIPSTQHDILHLHKVHLYHEPERVGPNDVLPSATVLCCQARRRPCVEGEGVATPRQPVAVGGARRVWGRLGVQGKPGHGVRLDGEGRGLFKN